MPEKSQITQNIEGNGNTTTINIQQPDRKTCADCIEMQLKHVETIVKLFTQKPSSR